MSATTIVKLYDAAETRARCPGKLTGCSSVDDGFKDERPGCGSFNWVIVRQGSKTMLRCADCGAEFLFDATHPPMLPDGLEWWAIGVTVEEVPE